MVKRVLILGNSSLVVFGMRGELIRRLREENYDVIVSFPTGSLGKEENPSKEYGCTYIETQIDRRGTNVFQDAELLKNYIKLIRETKPDVVLTYTVKCSIYGGMACRFLKVPCIVNITGLGKGLAEGGIRQKLLVDLYKVALKSAHCVFFQNQSDRQFFISHGIRYQKDDLLPGSGVNLEKFSPLPYPADDKFVFTYIARIMKTKGIDEFLAAAEVIKKERPDVEFHVCGFYEDNYKDIIENAELQGLVKYEGQVSDVRPYEEISHCIVLPTYHPEGISNVLLEAAACARPLITTDRPGCREVVDHGVNGYLIRERDSQDLLEKMRQFMELPWEARRDMGLAGRAKVESEFDRQIVVRKYMEELARLNMAV
jgi:galacturonosyltransferase